MFIVHKFSDQLVAPPQQSNNLEKYIVHQVFHKYLFKLCELGYCVSIINVDCLRNVIMRETSNIMVEILVEAMFIQLKEGDYIEGKVVEMDNQQISIQFLGCLKGIIDEFSLHQQTTFADEKNQWVYVTGQSTGYQWKIGDNIKAKIMHIHKAKEETDMTKVIRLRANEAGLGPVRWWI